VTDPGGRRHRYGAYTGGPDPLAPPLDVRAALDAVGERVLAGESLPEALRDLLRRNTAGRPGLDDLAARARRRRRELMRSGRLDGELTRAAALLDQALAAEREELAARPDDLDARFAAARLDALPTQTSAAVRDLRDYSWVSEQAAELYRSILDGLRSRVLDRQFEGLRQAVSSAGRDPAALQATRQLLADLNDLLAKHSAGEDTEGDFTRFVAKHGATLGETPSDIDELIDLLARRAATAQQLMRSLSAGQRAELADLVAEALAGTGLAEQMAALTEMLRQLRPDRARQMAGDSPLDYTDATSALQELSDLDELLDQLEADQPRLDAIDVDLVSRQLGRSSADQVRRLADLERQLREHGWLTRGDSGLQLSPKALRRLGATALRRVFADLEARSAGQHDMRSAGAAGEVTGSSRPWHLGDTQPLDVVRTVSNAIRRGGVLPGGAVTLDVADFEVMETEHRAGAAVALCVDLSYSMIAEGRWGPMKQTGLALAHLVSTRFRQDSLQIIGFGRHARTLSRGELAAVDPDYQQGTNLAHALALAARHLRRHPSSEPVVIVVTDGEPTAHLELDGHAVFAWPSTRRTIELTVREVDLLTRMGASLNIFMLGEDPGLRRFVDAIARRNGGRVFTPEAADLGRYVVADYLRARRGRRAG
jgi:uncharacterized protein with von Willebrand factor type A (vWA) domain